MQIILKEQLPEGDSGIYSHYNHKIIKNNKWKFLDVRMHVSKKESIWLDYIDNWHSNLSTVAIKHTRWWWFLNCSRLTSWHPPLLKPLFFAYALIELIEEKNIQKIILIECPQDVIYYIKEFRPNIDIVSYKRTIFKTRLRKLKRSVKHSLFFQKFILLKQIYYLLLRVYRVNKQQIDLKNLIYRVN